MLIQLLISIDHNAHEGQNGSRCRSEHGKHFNYRLSPAIIQFPSPLSPFISLSLSRHRYKTHDEIPSYFHLLYSQRNKLNKRSSFFVLTVSHWYENSYMYLHIYHSHRFSRFPPYFNNVKIARVPFCPIMR